VFGTSLAKFANGSRQYAFTLWAKRRGSAAIASLSAAKVFSGASPQKDPVFNHLRSLIKLEAQVLGKGAKQPIKASRCGGFFATMREKSDMRKYRSIVIGHINPFSYII